ncbi:MAG: hypothetical protein ACOVOR_04980 [Rhabdochlamydiaceae bacterium]
MDILARFFSFSLSKKEGAIAKRSLYLALLLILSSVLITLNVHIHKIPFIYKMSFLQIGATLSLMWAYRSQDSKKHLILLIHQLFMGAIFLYIRNHYWLNINPHYIYIPWLLWLTITGWLFKSIPMHVMTLGLLNFCCLSISDLYLEQRFLVCPVLTICDFLILAFYEMRHKNKKGTSLENKGVRLSLLIFFLILCLISSFSMPSHKICNPFWMTSILFLLLQIGMIIFYKKYKPYEKGAALTAIFFLISILLVTSRILKYADVSRMWRHASLALVGLIAFLSLLKTLSSSFKKSDLDRPFFNSFSIYSIFSFLAGTFVILPTIISVNRWIKVNSLPKESLFAFCLWIASYLFRHKKSMFSDWITPCLSIWSVIFSNGSKLILSGVPCEYFSSPFTQPLAFILLSLCSYPFISSALEAYLSALIATFLLSAHLPSELLLLTKAITFIELSLALILLHHKERWEFAKGTSYGLLSFIALFSSSLTESFERPLEHLFLTSPLILYSVFKAYKSKDHLFYLLAFSLLVLGGWMFFPCTLNLFLFVLSEKSQDKYLYRLSWGSLAVLIMTLFSLFSHQLNQTIYQLMSYTLALIAIASYLAIKNNTLKRFLCRK